MVDIFFLVWSLSRLLCFVGSGSSVPAALDHTATGIGFPNIRVMVIKKGEMVARHVADVTPCIVT